MSETKLTHWKKTIDKDWIGTYILPEGRPINVILERVEYKEVKIKGVKEHSRVAYFSKNAYFDKPMLINPTNCKRIEDLTGTPYIERWSNLNIPVTLCQEMDKAFGGGKDWALRISKTQPKLIKPTLIKDDSKIWDNAANKIKEVGYDKGIILIAKHYNITEETKTLLKNEADKA